MPDNKPSAEDQYRDDIKQAYAVVSKLAPRIQSTEDLASVLQLALDSDAQLRFLLSLITEPTPKR